MNTEERLTSLRKGMEAVKQEKLRAEMRVEAALKAREEALTALKEEFDVDTVEEAVILLRELEAQLETDISTAEKTLQEMT